MIEALIFDFDGILVDTEGCDYQAWVELYQSYGFSLPFEEYAECVGATLGQTKGFDPTLDLENKLGYTLDWKVVGAVRVRRLYDLTNKQPLMAGAKALLTQAQGLGLKLGVASSSPHAWVDSHLHRLGLESFFQTVKCAEDVVYTKPSPDLYLAAAAALNVLPEHALAIEDSEIGIAAAHAANMPCIAVPNKWTSHMSFHKANFQIKSLQDLSLDMIIQRINYD